MCAVTILASWQHEFPFLRPFPKWARGIRIGIRNWVLIIGQFPLLNFFRRIRHFLPVDSRTNLRSSFDIAKGIPIPCAGQLLPFNPYYWAQRIFESNLEDMVAF